MKKIITVGVAILIIVGLINILDKQYKNAINDCINAGHNKSYCEYYLR
jgi:hypothetical protein